MLYVCNPFNEYLSANEPLPIGEGRSRTALDLPNRGGRGGYDYSDANCEEVVGYLSKLRNRILDKWMPWTDTITPEQIIAELKLELRLWLARIWTEDCETYLRESK